MKLDLSKAAISAVMLAGELTLAACGGGSNGTGGTTDDDMATNPKPVDTSLQDAVDAQTTADNALVAAMELVETASKAAKEIMANDVNGVSKDAYDNAMTVLTAEAAVQSQYDIADGAHTDATEAHAAADDANKARVMTIVNAVKKARDDIMALQTATGEGSLDEAVKRVKTGRPINDSDAKIAQHWSDQVASAIETAIAAQVTTYAVQTGAPKGSVMRSPHSGMTFEQIAEGESKEVKKLGDFTSDAAGETALTALGSAVTRGASTGSDAFYMGIPGDLFCMSATCSLSDGKITGDVLFFPDDASALYAQATFGAQYTVVTDAATYGHWLDLDSTNDDALRVNLHANAATSTLDWDRNEGSKTSAEDIEATYSGMAGGYSERTVGTGENEKQTSGLLTAGVTLNATFGESTTTLAGTVSGFSGGDHVNPAWRVTLVGGTLATNTFTGTVTDGSLHGKQYASDGDWTAAAYGSTGMHASGFVGAFTADFSDGSAAGSYHAAEN